MKESSKESEKPLSTLLFADGLEWVPWWTIWETTEEMWEELEDLEANEPL